MHPMSTQQSGTKKSCSVSSSGTVGLESHGEDSAGEEIYAVLKDSFDDLLRSKCIVTESIHLQTPA